VSVTLHEVVAAARSREASFAAESAGYILLAAADQVAIAPRRVSLSGIELGDEGKVRLSSKEPCSAEVAEADVRALLGRLLLVASSSTPALLRVSRATESAGLVALVRELEAALIPVNRAAAQRALARLVRETTRALERGLTLDEEPERLESKPKVPAQPSPAPRLELVPAVLEPNFEVDVEFDAQDVEPERPAREAETRPEPVVRRSVAPSRAAPPPEPAGVAPVETPRLGTLVAVAAVLPEAPPEYDFTERMPPVSLAEPEATDSELEASAPEPEAGDSEPLAGDVEPVASAPELLASDVEPLASAAEPVAGDVEPVASAGEPEAGDEDEPLLHLLPEPLGENDIVIEEGPDAGLIEMRLPAEGELVFATESAASEGPEAELELAFTPSPHRATSVTLEELRGPDFEPEPDYEPEPLPLYEPEPEPEPTPPSLPRVKLRREPLRSEVQDLLREFSNETTPSEPDISRELRMLAGLDLTPPPATAGDH
jgi:hypothetical protein